MTYASHLAALGPELDAQPGTISVWVGPVGAATATFERRADDTHYAASTMKVAVLAALHRAGTGDTEVSVVNDFASALPGAPRYTVGRDDDDAVWERLGGTATLRWLARRMIIRSSNFATNIVLRHVGIPAVQQVLRDAGATRMRVERGIEDFAARDAGLDNVITARDLAALFGAVANDDAAIEVLLAQERSEDLVAGLPPGTRVAHKNGWMTGIRHAAGIVFPDDAAPYAIAVATSRPDNDDAAACQLVTRIATASWADRHRITS